MILLQTDEYSIKQSKLGFLDLYNKNGKKVVRLGHHIFLNNLKKCDENNFIIAFSKMNFSFEHYNINGTNYSVSAFQTTSPTHSYAWSFELSDDVFGVMASSKYGSSYILYNWQTRNYYKGHGDEMPSLNDNGDIIIPKKIKYDDECNNLYFEDHLEYKLDSKTFEIKEAYSDLQKRNINFANQNARKVLERECLENMKTLAILQKEGLQDEMSLKRVF